MGLMLAVATFQDEPPTPDAICAAISSISSLTAIVVDEIADEMCTFKASIAFECATDLPLEVCAYRTGSVADFCEETFDDEASCPPIMDVMQDPNGSSDTQTVRLEGYIGQERTLMATSQLALESLGGTFSIPIDEQDRKKYGTKISKSILASRRRETERQMQKTSLLYLALSPIFILLGIASFLWFTITTPIKLYRALQQWKRISKGMT